ncbi:MAG: ribonuclease J [Alphaproteobacteria bacterium]
MNLGLYGYGPPFDRTWIVVDFGLSFAGDNVPGVDLVFPDIGFLEEERGNIEGIFITHAHEDHFGALAALWPRLKVPVYATKFTANLLAAKLAGDPDAGLIPVEVVKAGSTIKAGPFEVEYVNVTHSIPESNALVIRTPLGTVVHSGDYRLDPTPTVGAPTDEARLRAVGDEGVLALISDSTNATREGGSFSEADVASEIADIIRHCDGRVAFTTFASNVGRVRSIALGAMAAGRHVVLSGRAFQRVAGVARECGMLEGLPPFLDEDAFERLPRDKVVVILTGSQGESRAALARVAQDRHPRISLVTGDTLVYSAWAIPGNERAVADIMNGLSELGVRIITRQERRVHVSGHPPRDEMQAMYGWLRPTVAIPVHGEALHLAAHAELARELGVETVLNVRNGAMSRLAPGPAEVIDHLETGRLYKDGAVIGDLEMIGAPNRRKLSFAGHVVVALVLDNRGDLLADPVIVAEGLPLFGKSGEEMADVLDEAVHGTLASLPRPRRRDREQVSQSVRRAIRAMVGEAWGKKPVCSVMTTIV